MGTSNKILPRTTHLATFPKIAKSHMRQPAEGASAPAASRSVAKRSAVRGPGTAPNLIADERQERDNRNDARRQMEEARLI
jgi:hypothetical protein